ncbi:MAG: hypothetical protein CMH27_07240 [Micavibrio sp.]|mgnify:CR=1 FL=1|nr:hypothetical protein [Micavibrio sp.]|tara:strand:+ start:5371 stop:5712 length:342 start_codon:yes stop_codon:yes gene_type:complete
MKTVPKYHTSNTDTVLAYQPEDLEKLNGLFSEAKQLWLATWEEQGRKDDGTCCLGKGIRIWFVGKRKRSAELLTVIDSPPCQGNLSASRSVGPALELLKSHGIEARYFDGWMD